MQVNNTILPDFIYNFITFISEQCKRISQAVQRVFNCIDEEPLDKNFSAKKEEEKPKIKEAANKALNQKKPPITHKFTNEDVQNNANVKKDQSERENDPIICPASNPKAYGEELYSMQIRSKFEINASDRARIDERKSFFTKYKTRLLAIADFFDLQTVYPVRGDGNCFCNSVVAGLLSLIIKDPIKGNEIRNVIEKVVNNTLAYVKPDPSFNAYTYSKKFTKAGDFETVLQRLDKGITQEDLSDFDFNAKFSRVIRYLLMIEASENSWFSFSHESGEEIDMYGILAINHIFKIDAKVVVLENKMKAKSESEDTDPRDPHKFAVMAGTDFFADPLQIRNAVQDPKETADFLVVHKAGHYFAIV